MIYDKSCIFCGVCRTDTKCWNHIDKYMMFLHEECRQKEINLGRKKEEPITESQWIRARDYQ